MNGNGALKLEVVSPTPTQLLTQKQIADANETPIGAIQVEDELGFAYLSGDIDFGAVGRNEIFQNIKYIVLTEYFSVPLDREFGMDYSMVDKPIPIAEAIFTQEVVMKIALYEPRAQFREIDFAEDYLAGKLSPTIKIYLVTADELPSMYGTITGSGAAVAPVPVPVSIATPETFSGSIVGLPGSQGPAGTVTVGSTTTGAPGTDALVTNSGTPSSAVLDFTIPEGEKGDQGTGITIKGTVANSGSLPTTGQQPGDMWIASDTGHGWSWDGTQWIDCGPIQGPKGATGPTGATGSQGATGAVGAAATITAGTTITGAAGTNANVVNVGSSSAAIFNFTIPQGIQGVQGTQGIQGVVGPPGQTWRGTWNASTNYLVNDAVEYQGSTFICTTANVNSPPVPDTGSNWLSPLANTGNRGSIAALVPSNQVLYYARGDNTWQLFPITLSGVATDHIDGTGASKPQSAGTIVQAVVFTVAPNLGATAISSAYSMTVAGSQVFGSTTFTPKYANSILRFWYSLPANVTGTMPAWYGFGLFKDAETTPRCQSWHYTTVASAGSMHAGSQWLTLASTSPIQFILRGAVGQAATTATSQAQGGAVCIDEIKQ